MVELADIFRRHGPQYRAKFKHRMLPSHLKAMRDIEQCRTEALGGQLYFCQDCLGLHFSYHSCKNRSCPKCQNEQTTAWLQKQSALLLPVPYFLYTPTLPAELRALARSNQKLVYDILLRTSAAALKKLALDPKFLGGQIGMVGVLQTWARDMGYHLHAHFIVPAGGLSADGKKWVPTRYKNFLVPEPALSVIFREKFKDEIIKAGLYDKVPAKVWTKQWVVDCEPVGTGQEVIKYLAPYVYRIAISNNRIEKLENGQVTFRYKQNGTRQWKRKTLDAEKFIHRFLQHVLPMGFQKIRYYGLMSPTNRTLLDKAKILLGASTVSHHKGKQPRPQKPLHCPVCGGNLIMLFRIPKKKRAPPCLDRRSIIPPSLGESTI